MAEAADILCYFSPTLSIVFYAHPRICLLILEGKSGGGGTAERERETLIGFLLYMP